MMRFFVQLGNFHPHFTAHQFREGIAEFFEGSDLNVIFFDFLP